MRRALLAGALAALAVAAAPSGAATTACRPASLRATFTLVRGSGAAGHVTYRLRLTNRGAHACVVSGRPALRLLDRRGRQLPTSQVADRPGTGTAALITIAHARAAVSDVQLSPDVPGPGEQAPGPCEPRAYRVRVTIASPGGGALVAPVRPATPVCEHGRLVVGLLHAA